MRDITTADLNRIGGRSRSSMRKMLVDAINKHARDHGITTVDRMAMFLANIKIESGHFRRMEENLSYSAGRLRQVWPRRFPTLAKAKQYARNSKKLANYVYGGRMGNKGRPNAGWLYRGSGPGQMTGYNNFKEFQDKTGIPVVSKPELMRDPDTGTLAICKFWQINNMNRFADKGDVRGGRKIWNGGYTHLKEVEDAYVVAKRVLSAGSMPQSNPAARYDTREIQTLLCHAGIKVGVDGTAGRKTVAAIKQFQRQQNLKVDGVAGPKTYAALKKAAAPQKINNTKPDTSTQPAQKRGKAVPMGIAALIALTGGGVAYFKEYITSLFGG